MRSDNLQLPCVQPPTSSYNFQLPHGHHCIVIMVATVMVYMVVMLVMVVVVNMVVMVVKTGQDRTGH